MKENLVNWEAHEIVLYRNVEFHYLGL